MALWYFECDRGAGIRQIPTRKEDKAYKVLLKETGTYDSPKNVRLATNEDKEWIKAMGGHVPS